MLQVGTSERGQCATVRWACGKVAEWVRLQAELQAPERARRLSQKEYRVDRLDYPGWTARRLSGGGALARIVYLSADAEPPADGDWVFVALDPTGRFRGTGAVASDRMAIFYLPDEAASQDYETAVDRAVDWAERHGAPIVYVRREIR